MSIRSSARLILTTSALVLCVGATAAKASTFLFQWDDAEPYLTGNTYQDGTLIQSVVVGQEGYSGSYGLWDGALASSFDVSFNIYESAGGALSDTWHLFGERGAGSLSIPFYSDVEGQVLQPLANAFTLVETGNWQRV